MEMKVVDHNVPRSVYVTEEERVKLLSHSTSVKIMVVTFAGDRTWLDNTPENAWTFALLADWRGLNK
jgi:hypothetical protein